MSGPFVPLHDMVQQAIHGSLEKLGGVQAPQPEGGSIAAPAPVAMWTADDCEKLAMSLEYAADNLGVIVDDRTPMERLAEQVHVQDALQKMAAGEAQPPMHPGDDRSTFPSAPGVGIPTDLHSPPGGGAAQAYTPDHSVPQVTPPMSPPMVSGTTKDTGPGKGGMGEALQTDEDHAPGGSATNPEFAGPKGPGFKPAIPKTGSVLRIAGLLKQAQDPSSPQPVITQTKVAGDPQQPALGYDAAPSGEQMPPSSESGMGAGGDGNQLRRFIANNDAPQNVKPGQLSVTQSRVDMRPLLDQPMQDPRFDTKLRENLQRVPQAGPTLGPASGGTKTASAQDPQMKVAAAKALLKKAAEMGVADQQGAGGQPPSPEQNFATAMLEGEKTAQGPGTGVATGMPPGTGAPTAAPVSAPLTAGLGQARQPGQQARGPILGSSTAPAAV